VLQVCAGADDYTRLCAVLTGYAESDYRSDAVQHGATFGVFQQTSRYWPSAHGSTADQCRAFLADFRSKAKQHNGDAVRDCWLTQQWAAPDPRADLAGFRAAAETLNYTRRLPDVLRLIAGTLTL
jgi:hypothetical protein